VNIAETVRSIPKYWKEPAPGKYIPNREFAAYSFGGIGVSTVKCMFVYVELNAKCFLIGSALGIDPTHLGMLNVAMGIITMLKTPFVSMLVDNTRSRLGKFRPYLLYAGFPAVVLLIAIAYIPPEADYNLKLLLIGLLYGVLKIFQDLYETAFNGLGQVMTPNGNERNTLLSISSLIYNFGPSVVQIFLPLLAELTGGLTHVNTYRVFMPVFSIFGVLLGIWTVTGTQERLIVPKNYVAKVKFKEGLTQVLQNKYFWLLNAFNVLGALKYVMDAIRNWYCFYVLQDGRLVGLVSMVMGTASVPGMLLAPAIAKRLGKRNAMILFFIEHAVFAFAALFFLDRTLPLFACLYLSSLGLGGEFVLTQSMTADIYDYQQWKTGQRIEGFITQFGFLLTSSFGLLTGLIAPFLYKYYGLEKNYDVLYDAAVHMPIFKGLIWLTIVSSLLAVIPLFFYNLTEEKHEEIVDELKRVAEDSDAVLVD